MRRGILLVTVQRRLPPRVQAKEEVLLQLELSKARRKMMKSVLGATRRQQRALTWRKPFLYLYLYHRSVASVVLHELHQSTRKE
jgi:hypothetical protein